ncbi:pentatricopeptide repeat-containing protein At1g62670, mitochondrial-like [Solanum dulcamara]|uniref:pentatricopeptide repeat-containing protein At1g62670, mitochondrial-like n=1 Tax=Solanum dulcamara TaxID=45834 RepID=UPI0024860996|nr:pentatricopeptide repeat-containing protein At1g62670, mitochondrial-like [Solanum dulcamara]
MISANSRNPVRMESDIHQTLVIRTVMQLAAAGYICCLMPYMKLHQLSRIPCLYILKIESKLGIPINGVIQNSVINGYCLMHRADCGLSLLPIYLKNGISFDVVTFTTLIRGIFAENKVKDAVELFKKVVREKICEPNQVMHATVMNGLSKTGHTQKTSSLLRLMEQGNTKPDICIYNIVVDALCSDRNLDTAINLLNEIKQKGIPPNIVTYNTLIDGLCKLGQWEKVKTLFSEMVVNLNIYPNVCTFTIVIDGLCKEGKVADAKEVVGHMVKKGVEPDIITYNAMMDYIKKKLDEAMQLFREISQKGSMSNIVTTLLSCKYGLVEEAMSLFKKLERKREDTSIAFYNVVINGLCKNGKLKEAYAVFENLYFIGLLPDVRTYNVMINGFCLEGLFDEAKEILRKMEDNGCFPDSVTYNVIVQGFLRSNKISEIATFMKEMAERGFLFDATTTELLVNIIRKNPSVLDMIPELHSEKKQ